MRRLSRLEGGLKHLGQQLAGRCGHDGMIRELLADLMVGRLLQRAHHAE